MSRNDQYISEGSDATAVIKSTSPSSSLSRRQSSFSIHDPVRSVQHAAVPPSASSSPSLSSLRQHFHHISPVSGNVILLAPSCNKTSCNSSLLETSLNWERIPFHLLIHSPSSPHSFPLFATSISTTKHHFLLHWNLICPFYDTKTGTLLLFHNNKKLFSSHFFEGFPFVCFLENSRKSC